MTSKEVNFFASSVLIFFQPKVAEKFELKMKIVEKLKANFNELGLSLYYLSSKPFLYEWNLICVWGMQALHDTFKLTPQPERRAGSYYALCRIQTRSHRLPGKHATFDPSESVSLGDQGLQIAKLE